MSMEDAGAFLGGDISVMLRIRPRLAKEAEPEPGEDCWTCLLYTSDAADE